MDPRLETIRDELPDTNPFPEGSIEALNWRLYDLSDHYHDEVVNIPIGADRTIRPDSPEQYEHWMHSRWKSGYFAQVCNYVEDMADRFLPDTPETRALREGAIQLLADQQRRVVNRKSVEAAGTTEQEIERAKNLIARAKELLHQYHSELPDYSRPAA